MKVINCPNCGSDNISKNSWSAEYVSSVKWNCDDCNWYYRKGSGMGTGSSNDGVHPRSVTPKSENGEYCSNCEFVVKGNHFCSPREIILNSNKNQMDISELENKLDEFNLRSHEIEDAIRKKEISLTPTFFKAQVWPRKNNSPTRTDMHEEIEKEIEREGKMGLDELMNNLAVQSKLERTFIRTIIYDDKNNLNLNIKGTMNTTISPKDD